ncbi:uncharacterized protein TA04745 [Theileria annulata]|uniref:Uncharacterized protein n=1 Tax=Theileria annulata TaxID=5874 RepID=Q4UBV9_THEAN|nr:uncharacterized protein TA04745 [Theileria annulata]CAI75692.1 hypothetical protein TA04745 [Theileria annulata]|eukprot:XP_955168.1 hypothetical protein TA04745 [Theileria annulata]
MFNNELDSIIINKLQNSLNIPNTNTNNINTIATVTNSNESNTNSTNKENKKYGIGYKKKLKISSDKLKLLNHIHQSNFKTKKKINKINKINKNNEKNEKKDNITRLDLIFNNQ